jgi:hypothetical protein
MLGMALCVGKFSACSERSGTFWMCPGVKKVVSLRNVLLNLDVEEEKSVPNHSKSVLPVIEIYSRNTDEYGQ